ncbi:response regulator [Cohnella nanjingensis]|uniref:Response regulator n=1 Tax=Cohnella nanjingensis TaxID=1387779 RepID=A0A7X0VJM2_9BACL|nr:response regulator [Cohnella nanjingensis]MBB6674874.1 response regulator [Cohnella nanjingensis]
MYNILIVDDEPLICKGLSNLLQTSGLNIRQIFTAHSGHEALDYLRIEDIDLLVTDIQMGAMNGIELMHQAKIIKPWVQAIIISAHETFQYAQLAIRLGAKDYLIKPLKSEQFLDSVRNVLLHMDKPIPAEDEYMSQLREHFQMEVPQPQRMERLNRMLSGDGDRPEAAELAELGLRGPYFALIKVKLDLEAAAANRRLQSGDEELLRYAAFNIVSELLGKEWSHAAFYSPLSEISILIQWDEAAYGDSSVDKINQLEMIGRSLHHNIAKYLELPCVVGISQILKGGEFLHVLNEQARKAILWNREHKDHFVFYYGDFKWNLFGEEPTEEEWTERNNQIVDKAMAYIQENYAQKGLTLHEVAQRNHVSPNYLSYLFKKNTGFNLWEYVIKLRMEESKRLLLQTDLRRYEIAERVGYESPEHFSKIFKKYYGVSPSELKK